MNRSGVRIPFLALPVEATIMGELPKRWTHGGFAAFRQGEFDNGGDNLYATASGAVEWIHRTDVNGDGHVDLVFPNSHGYDERGPTWIYTMPRTWTATGSSTWSWSTPRTGSPRNWIRTCTGAALPG